MVEQAFRRQAPDCLAHWIKAGAQLRGNLSRDKLLSGGVLAVEDPRADVLIRSV
jgi:hypothetical protein